MVKLLKITLLIISIILMIIIGTVILLPLIIDPNDYKPEIEAAAYRYTEKKLVLEGSLDLTVFPWLGVTTGKVLILNPSTPDQQALATIDEGQLKVKLLPLLRKRIELSRIVLKNPIIHLITDKEGINNWSKKAPAKIAAAEKQLPDTGIPKNSEIITDDTQKSSFLQEMMIAGVNIENGRIIRINEQKNRQTEVTHFNCEIGTLAYNQPVPVNLSMKLQRKSSQSEQLTVKGLAVFNKNLDHFKLTDVEINALVEKPSVDNNIVVTARSQNIELDWQQQGLKVEKLNVTSGNMILSANLVGNKIIDNPEIKGIVTLNVFNPREFLTYLRKPVPETKDNSSLTRLSGSFNLLASKNSAQFNDFQAQLDDSNIAGNVHVTDFKQPAFKFNLTIDTLNLDRYSLIKPTSKKNIQAPVQEQTKTPEKSATEQRIKISEGPQPDPDPQRNKQKKPDSTIFPIDLLRKINATGTFSISKITTKGLSLKNLTINLDAKNGVLKTNNLLKQFLN